MDELAVRESVTLAGQAERARAARTFVSEVRADSEPIPLAALTRESLSYTLQVAMLAIARHRWRLLSPTQTPNLTSFRAPLATRYGWNDDGPHRDRLSDVLTADGTLRQLIED